MNVFNGEIHPSIHLYPLIWGQVAGAALWAGRPGLPSPQTPPTALTGGSFGDPWRSSSVTSSVQRPGSSSGRRSSEESWEHTLRYKCLDDLNWLLPMWRRAPPRKHSSILTQSSLTTGEGWAVDWLVNGELHLFGSAPPSPWQTNTATTLRLH